MKNSDVIITILGDICPVKDTMAGFISGNPQTIMSPNILNVISESDITVGNLECALTDNPTPIKKAGPVLYAPTISAQTISNAGISTLSLANNHIRDCGDLGVESTITACRSVGINVFGAGKSKKEAGKPYIVEAKNIRIAFVSLAEHEFNAVGSNCSGAAIFDVFDDFKRLKDIKSTVDYMIVLYHGGIEYHPYPSPLLQKKCRLMVEAGADYVLCQHSHCIGTYEKYGDSTIIYGQGNSLFGYRENNKGWNEGLLVRLSLSANSRKIEFLPIVTGPNGILNLISDARGNELLNEIEDKSKKILSNEFINCSWMEFCKKAELIHLPLLLGWNRYLIFMNRVLKGWPLRILCGRHKRNIIHNLIRCDSHYEVLRTILHQSDYK